MSDLERACRILDIDPGRVVKHRYEGDEYVILADYGVGGVKKHRVPLPPAQPEPDEPSLDDLGYRELQELAMALGVRANQSREALIAELSAADVSHEEEE